VTRAEIDRLMTAAADGDRDAIDPLFQALWPIALDYATRFLHARADAEDAAQDALVRLFAQVDRFDRSRDALAWAITHVVWQCRTVRRRVQRRGECGELPQTALDGAAHAEERDLVRTALATVATLAPRDVEVIVAAIADDDALRDAIAPATFRKRLERALARLRISWRSRHGAL
jgi:RNA polymerase sigma-70 factor (ECF subfamily)